MMDAEKMRLALELATIHKKHQHETLRAENVAILQSIGLQQEAQDFFIEFSFDEEVTVGLFYYHQTNCLKKSADWEEDFQRALSANLLLIGSGTTGDPVALDLVDYQVGILFHDYFWGEDAEDPRKFLIKMGCSLGQFFYNTIDIKDYPADAYEAATYTNAEFTGLWSPDKE